MNRGGIGAHSFNIELQAALNTASERKVERSGAGLILAAVCEGRYGLRDRRARALPGMEQRRKEIRLVGKLGPAKGVLVGCVVAAVLWILFALAVWLAVH